MRGANFRNRSSIVMYAAGLGIAHVGFVNFRVVGDVRVAGDISKAEEVTFTLFEIVGGVDAEGV